LFIPVGLGWQRKDWQVIEFLGVIYMFNLKNDWLRARCIGSVRRRCECSMMSSWSQFGHDDVIKKVDTKFGGCILAAFILNL